MRCGVSQKGRTNRNRRLIITSMYLLRGDASDPPAADAMAALGELQDL